MTIIAIHTIVFTKAPSSDAAEVPSNEFTDETRSNNPVTSLESSSSSLCVHVDYSACCNLCAGDQDSFRCGET